MLLTILGAIKLVDIAKTSAITMARISGPGKDEDDILLARMLEETVVEDNEDDDEPDGYDDIYQELENI